MCSYGNAIDGLNTLASCPRQQLIVTKECVPISQPCGGGDQEYFKNPFTNTFLDGLIQVNNSGTCRMIVSVTDANGTNEYSFDPKAGFKLVVENLRSVKVRCAPTDTSGTASNCAGQLYLELHQCVTCF